MTAAEIPPFLFENGTRFQHRKMAKEFFEVGKTKKTYPIHSDLRKFRVSANYFR